MNHPSAHSQSSSKKSFPPTAHTTPQRNAPVAAKTLVGVLPTQQPSPKPAKTRSPVKKSSPSKQEQQQQQHHHQPSDDSSSSPSPQKKRSNRSAGKVLSAGSLADVKSSKPLSQESVTILKRGDLGNMSNILADPFTVTRNETAPPNHMNRNSLLIKLEQSRSRDSSPSRRRNVQPPSKSRRAQRRKDVEAITDALQNSEADMLGTSPPQANDSTSSSDSNDDVPVITGNEKVVTVSKAEPKRRSKRERVVSSPPTTTSVTAFPPLTATVATEKDPVVEVKSSSTLRVTFAKSASQTRRSSSPAMEIRHHVAPFSGASSLALASATVSETVVKAASRTPPTSPPQSMTSPLYAGPTFSNSPAPNALPLPSFNSRGLGETSPVSTSVLHPDTFPTTPTATRSRTTSATSFLTHHQPRNGAFEADEDIFRMDNVGELHAPMYQQDMRARSRDLMGLLSTSVATQPKSVPHPAFTGASTTQSPSFQGHQLPLKMMRSHPFQNGITREMTMSLRNMLKIAQD